MDTLIWCLDYIVVMLLIAGVSTFLYLWVGVELVESDNSSYSFKGCDGGIKKAINQHPSFFYKLLPEIDKEKYTRYIKLIYRINLYSTNSKQRAMYYEVLIKVILGGLRSFFLFLVAQVLVLSTIRLVYTRYAATPLFILLILLLMAGYQNQLSNEAEYKRRRR